MANMVITTFYFPGSRENLKMSTEDTESFSSGEEDLLSLEEKILTDLMIGFVGTQNNDISYETLLQHIDFNWEFDFESDDEIENEVAKAVYKNRSPMFQVRRESIPDEVKAELVLNWLYKNRARDQEALRLGWLHKWSAMWSTNFKLSNEPRKEPENRLSWSTIRSLNGTSKAFRSSSRITQRHDLL